MPSFPLTRERRLGLTCGLRPTFTPGEESRSAEGEPAEGTLIGRLRVTRRPLTGCDRFAGIGVSVAPHDKSIVRLPGHCDACPPILDARAVIEPKTDVAGTGIVPPVCHVAPIPVGKKKTPVGYRLAKAQFRNISTGRYLIPPDSSGNDSVNRKLVLTKGKSSKAAKGQEVARLIELKRVGPISVPWKSHVQNARIMYSRFHRLATGECRSGACGGIRGPPCLRNGCGFGAESVTFHKTRLFTSSCASEPFARGCPAERSQVELLGTH